MGSIEHSLAVRPCRGELRSGDAALVREMSGEQLLAVIVDATGHGAEAYAIASRVIGFAGKCRRGEPARLLTQLHEVIAGTRGAAVGVCLLDTARGALAYAGCGNTIIRRLGESDTRLVSRDGVVGGNMRTPKVQQLTLNHLDLVVMHTDGIADKYRHRPFGGGVQQSAKRVVDRLIDEFGKSYDDAGCIAMRYRTH